MTEERRSAAIIFCDICDFANIAEEDEAQAQAIAAKAGSCIRQARATSALAGAIEVQKAVAKHNAEAESHEQFQLRIEVHAGDVIVSDGEVSCDGIDVASRIEPLASPGGIRISRGVLDLIHNRISGG